MSESMTPLSHSPSDPRILLRTKLIRGDRSSLSSLRTFLITFIVRITIIRLSRCRSKTTDNTKMLELLMGLQDKLLHLKMVRWAASQLTPTKPINTFLRAMEAVMALDQVAIRRQPCGAL